MSTQSTTLHPKADKLFIEKMISPEYRTYTDADSEEVFRLFNKYIEYRYSYSKNDCGCENSINKLWDKLREWYNNNSSKFEK